MRNTYLTKRKKLPLFDSGQLPRLITEFEKSQISYEVLVTGISLFEKIGNILTKLEIKLPLYTNRACATFTASDQNEEGNYVDQLLRLRNVCVTLLHGAKTERKAKKRKMSETSRNSEESDQLQNSNLPAKKLARMNRDPDRLDIRETPGSLLGQLEVLNICYMCKILVQPHPLSAVTNKSGDEVRHNRYDWMCRKCGKFNLQKRTNSADLTGKVALVTGGRMKIGFEIVLKLLRANASTVIVTTRFPVDAYRRFEAEPDFTTWSSRLRIYKLDLRFLANVNSFCEEILQNFGRLDILIQNAAQTIRRPAAYYEELVKSEIELGAKYNFVNNQILAPNRPVLEPDLKFTFCETTSIEEKEGKRSLHSGVVVSPGKNIPLGTSQLLVHPDDFKFAENSNLSRSVFPIGQTDADGNQLDLRSENTWILELERVEPAEMVEVTVANYMAPFIILQKLTPIMQRTKTTKNSDLGFVVLVSAMEGKFDCRQKTSKHPHTNAAKAALNMLVRTSARHYYKKLGLILNAVDTGWVTDEHPVGHFCRLPAPPPLDIVDGAARVLDPIFHTINNPDEHPMYGKFLKDYLSKTW